MSKRFRQAKNADEHFTVLIAQRHADSREMYADFLRAHGFSILDTASGVEALRLASRADVIVTSIRLDGDLDGLDLIASLRRHATTRTTPVVVVASKVYERDRQNAQAAGCDAFLPMPCLPDALLREVRKVLVRRVHRRRPAKAKLRGQSRARKWGA